MKNFARLSIFALVAVVAPLAVHADTLAFHATGSGFESSGILTTTPDATLPGVFDITAISGEVNGVAITGLLPGSYNANSPTTNSTGVFIFDNLLLGGSPMFDYNGVGFNIGLSGYQGNFFFDAGTYEFLDSNAATTALTDFSTTSQTPEPSSFLLMGSGALGLAQMLRRRLMA